MQLNDADNPAELTVRVTPEITPPKLSPLLTLIVVLLITMLLLDGATQVMHIRREAGNPCAGLLKGYSASHADTLTVMITHTECIDPRISR